MHESNPERIDDIFSHLPAADSGQSPVYSLQGKLAPTVKQALKIYKKFWSFKFLKNSIQLVISIIFVDFSFLHSRRQG